MCIRDSINAEYGIRGKASMRFAPLVCVALAAVVRGQSDWEGVHPMPDSGSFMNHEDHDVQLHGPYPSGHPDYGYHEMPTEAGGEMMAHGDHNVELHGPYPPGHPNNGYHEMPPEAGGGMMAHEDHYVELHGEYPVGHPAFENQFPTVFDNNQGQEHDSWTELPFDH
eukprot:TRINITY_DN18853_c0_g1_i2.p1 TRINITY_DN18853_c0_g1~~TRINITY_DN18853_c0_g1_i2.p1  ORF type:complete len:167 (+),score=34.24 TRINITY_DN18853_c0_g1_i2:143-643(+)